MRLTTHTRTHWYIRDIRCMLEVKQHMRALYQDFTAWYLSTWFPTAIQIGFPFAESKLIIFRSNENSHTLINESNPTIHPILRNKWIPSQKKKIPIKRIIPIKSSNSQRCIQSEEQIQTAVFVITWNIYFMFTNVVDIAKDLKTWRFSFHCYNLSLFHCTFVIIYKNKTIATNNPQLLMTFLHSYCRVNIHLRDVRPLDCLLSVDINQVSIGI